MGWRYAQSTPPKSGSSQSRPTPAPHLHPLLTKESNETLGRTLDRSPHGVMGRERRKKEGSTRLLDVDLLVSVPVVHLLVPATHDLQVWERTA